jgi:hypothetical protein
MAALAVVRKPGAHIVAGEAFRGLLPHVASGKRKTTLVRTNIEVYFESFTNSVAFFVYF